MASENTQFKKKEEYSSEVVALPTSAPLDATLQALQAQLLHAQLDEITRKRAKELEAEQQKELSRLAGIEATQVQIRRQLETQANCSHRKENGRTHLAGQRVHGGKLVLLCQQCQKVFGDDPAVPIPPNLMPMGEGIIGGPQN